MTIEVDAEIEGDDLDYARENLVNGITYGSFSSRGYSMERGSFFYEILDARSVLSPSTKNQETQ